MRRLAVTVLTAMGIAGGVACGLELSGEGGLPPIPLPERDDGGNKDATPVGELPEAGSDILPGETPLDGGELEAGNCGPAGVQDNFANGIEPTKWVVYGKVTKTLSQSQNALARLIATDDGEEAAGLFFLPKVSATSFTASFSYFAQRPYVEWWEDDDYADGLTFTWLTDGDPANLGKEPTTVVAGGGLGLPNATKGFGFALDCYRNSAPQDLDGPSFSVFALDSSRGVPGSYDWHLRKSGPWTGVYDSWHKVTITYAGGKLSASIDTTVKVFEGVDVPPAKIRAIGFSAATGGGQPVGFFIDTVDIKLTDATCP